MKNFKRFNDVKQSDLLVDMHMHSTFTDGEGSVEEIARTAIERGLSRIAITDHVRKDSIYVPDYFEEIDRISARCGIEILKGVEAKVENFSGSVDVHADVRQKADLVIASVHRFPIGRKLYAANKFEKEIAQTIEMELAYAAVCAGACDVLGHPGGMSLKAHNEFPLEYFEELMKVCSSNDVIFEVSSAYHKPIASQLIPLLQKYNPLVSFSSDAHTLDRIGENCEEFVRYFDEQN